MIRSLDGAKRNPGTAFPHSASLHAGYDTMPARLALSPACSVDAASLAERISGAKICARANLA
ncbi:hypothetical protein [Bradyrhizobium canariense]|uniref:hypothetical protein n=1 Tax=Bradyrhizobium canariense TaxID=255045 RepID=UPI000A195ECC|nr:hypothetical protein [Bradyrhizobium canariense]OSI55833.1 hypothetical protein BSZ15_18700 [Bradyrhizobium canariense]